MFKNHSVYFPCEVIDNKDESNNREAGLQSRLLIEDGSSFLHYAHNEGVS